MVVLEVKQKCGCYFGTGAFPELRICPDHWNKYYNKTLQEILDEKFDITNKNQWKMEFSTYVWIGDEYVE